MASRDSDAEWHADKDMPCVPVGSFFDLVGGDGESSYNHKELQVTGPTLLALTLRAEIDTADGVIKLAADTDAVAECASFLWIRIADEPGAVDPLAKAPASVAHHDASGARLFVTNQRQMLLSRANEQRVCPIAGCSKKLKDATATLQHSRHHVLHTPHKVLYSETCPLCLGPESECPPFVVKAKTGNSLQPRVACSVYAPSANRNNPEHGVKFTTASLAKSTTKTPSTNRPIICPACHPDLADDAHNLPSTTASKKYKSRTRPAVWSYNTKAHWDRLHASTTMPAGLKGALKVTLAEKKGLTSHFEKSLLLEGCPVLPSCPSTDELCFSHNLTFLDM